MGVFDDAGPLGYCGGLVFDHGGGKSDDGGIAFGAGVGLAEPCGGGDGIALAPFFEEYAVEIVAVEWVVDRVEIKQPIGGLVGILLGEAAEVGLDGIGDGVGGIDLEEVVFGGLWIGLCPLGDAVVEELGVILFDGFAEGPLGSACGVDLKKGIDECCCRIATDGAALHLVDPSGSGFGAGGGPVAEECACGGGFTGVIGHAIDPVGSGLRIVFTPKGNAEVEGFSASDAGGVFFEPEECGGSVAGGPEGNNFEHSTEAVAGGGVAEDPL